MFFKGLKEAGGDETKIQTICGALQISFFHRSGTARTEAAGSQIRTATAKATLMEVGKANQKWCRMFVQILRHTFSKGFEVSMTLCQSGGVPT